MPEVSARREIWSMVHAERAALADDLAGLEQAGVTTART